MDIKKLWGEVAFHTKCTWTWAGLCMAGVMVAIVVAWETARQMAR